MLQALKIQLSADSDALENCSRISGKASEITVISMLTMKTDADAMPTVHQPSRPTGGRSLISTDSKGREVNT